VVLGVDGRDYVVAHPDVGEAQSFRSLRRLPERVVGIDRPVLREVDTDAHEAKRHGTEEQPYRPGRHRATALTIGSTASAISRSPLCARAGSSPTTSALSATAGTRTSCEYAVAVLYTSSPMDDFAAAPWYAVRPAASTKPATYRCPLCRKRLPALAEHMLVLPEGDPARRRHAHTTCVMRARRAGRLPLREEVEPSRPGWLSRLLRRGTV
jgi:hypothetical protein